MTPLGAVVGLILIAVGAILTWAVTTDAEGININAVGVILMIVGLVSFLLSLVLWAPWRAGATAGYTRRERYVDEAPVRRRRVRPAARETVIEEEEEYGPPGAPPP